MNISMPGSLNKQFLTLVILACLIVLASTGTGLWSLLGHNERIISLTETKAETGAALTRLDAIAQRLALFQAKNNQQVSPQLVEGINHQFADILDHLNKQTTFISERKLNAVWDSWQVLISESLSADTASRAHLFSTQQQLSSHLQALNQDFFNKLERERIAAYSDRQSALLLTLLGGVIGVIVGSWLVIRRVTRLSDQLHTLGRGMAIAAVGDLSQRVNVQGCSEIEALSEGFNYMASELEQQSQELKLSEQGLLTVMNSAPDAIISIDILGRVISWNAAAERLFVYTTDEMHGEPLQTIFDPSQHADVARILAECRNFESDKSDQIAGPWELTVRRKDGLHKPVEISIRDMLIDGQKGLVVVGRDITERKAAAEKMAFLTQHDSLTQLPNRSLIRDLLIQAMTRADNSERLVGIITVGIDHFSDVNDNLGHALGDALLVAFADKINNKLSRRDSFGRIGGDEFCIVLDGMRHVGEANTLCDQISLAMAEPFRLGGQEVFVTISMGVALYPFDDESPEVLLKNASAAMYRCKRQDARHVLFYADEMNRHSSGRVQLTAELKRALENEQFCVHYQPLLDAMDDRVIGAEALLRWNHPERGILAPAHFIPILEETGLVVPVGHWVMAEACRHSTRWRQLGFNPLRISINLSARQFKEDGFIAEIKQLTSNLVAEIAHAGQHSKTPQLGDCLEFELTEGVLMEDTETSRETLIALKEMGIQLSVDDFGTGYSSLSYLKQFPIDALKIDQSFVRDIGRSQDAELIVQAIIDLAHNLRLHVVGEGVETRQQRDFLRQKGCDVFQGHYYGAAMTADTFEAFLKSQRGSKS